MKTETLSWHSISQKGLADFLTFIDSSTLIVYAYCFKNTSLLTNRLECTEQCALIERNKRLALALEIKNPDISGKLGAPSYTEFLKDSARFVWISNDAGSHFCFYGVMTGDSCLPIPSSVEYTIKHLLNLTLLVLQKIPHLRVQSGEGSIWPGAQRSAVKAVETKSCLPTSKPGNPFVITKSFFLRRALQCFK